MDDLKPVWPDAPRRCPELVLPAVRFIPGHRPRPKQSHAGFDVGVDLYHQGYLWEAHEAWEAEFKGPDRVFVQGLIQLAAMLLKSHVGNEAGVRKLYTKSRANLARITECRGIDVANLVAQLDRFYATRDWADAPRLFRARPTRDGGLRLFGMVVGAGVGALALIIPSNYGGMDGFLFLGLPGIGLAIGAGVFSLGRRPGWGIAAGIAGMVWSAFLVWLRFPTRFSLAEILVALPFTFAGAINLGLVMLAGVLVGSGWKKSVRRPPEPDDELWD